MFMHYLKLALRIIKRQKAFSFINIFGLAVGMSCCIVIFLFVQEELSFDRFHQNADRIIRVVSAIKTPTSSMPYVQVSEKLGSEVKKNIPEISDFVRIGKGAERNFTFDGKEQVEPLNYADPTIFQLFSFPLVSGEKNTALSGLHTAVLSRKLSLKWFGNDNPIGKVVTVDGKFPLTISGVMEDIPTNSHLQFEILISYATAEIINPPRPLTYTYLLLNEHIDLQLLRSKIESIKSKWLSPRAVARIEYSLQPLTSIHLGSDLPGEFRRNSNIRSSYILVAVAFLILLLACINYINLFVARAVRRVKEIGIRKIVGADRRQLIFQLLGESILLTLIALGVALLLAQILLPIFNSLMERKLAFDVIGNYGLYASLFVLTLLTGLLSGGYPALILSRAKPASAMKSGETLRRKVCLRRGLVVFQFAASLIFIIAALVVMQQMRFVNQKALGFIKENIVNLPVAGELHAKAEVVQNLLLQNSLVRETTFSSLSPGVTPGLEGGLVPEGELGENKIPVRIAFVNPGFFTFFNISVKEGSGFEASDAPVGEEVGSKIIANEKAAALLGGPSSLGKVYTDPYWKLKGPLVGIVKDFHTETLHEDIKPTIFLPSRVAFMLSIKIDGSRTQEALSFIESTIKQVVPHWILKLNFLDEDIAKGYRDERKIQQLTLLSSVFSIFIACLGLYGLVSYSVEQRTKEIGIRKVLGASMLSISRIVNQELLYLFLAANVVACPAAYYLMLKWLRNFAFRTNIGWETFAFSISIGVLLVVATVSFQTIRAARMNPVTSLRYE